MSARFALLLLLFCAPALADNTEDAKAALDRGLAYAEKGDIDNAIKEFTKAIQLNPDLVLPYYDRALACCYKGDYDHAIADFTKAIELKPDYFEAYNNRGNAYNDKGDFDRAIADYTKAIELKPDYLKAYFNRGTACDHKGDYDRAITDFTKVVALKPDLAFAYDQRGNAYVHKGDSERAILDFTKAIELWRDNPKAAYSHVRLFLLKERLHQDGRTALAEFRKTMKKDAWMANVVRMFLSEITPEDCVAAVSDKDPRTDKEKMSEAHYYIGQFYLLKGDADRARKSLQSCVDIGLTDYVDYFSAQAELKRLGPPTKK